MSDIILTSEQADVKSKVLDYITAKLRGDAESLKLPAYKTLGGLAGTGKTTLVKEIIKDLRELKITAIVVAFTGKACDVLRRKEVNASTIHSTIYSPVYKEGLIVGYNKRSRYEICADKNWVFVVDESSMVAKDQFNDLLELGVPILFVGDHGQLEPVGDDPKIMSRRDFELTQIQRQAAESNIIKLAYEVRNPSPWPPRVRRENDVLVLPHNSITDTDLLWADKIICVYNKTRHQYNHRLRALTNMSGLIDVGDKLICLKNNNQLGVFNGQEYIVDDILDDDEIRIAYSSGRGDTDYRNIRVDTRFLGKDIEKDVKFDREKVVIDYGYAVTCHKSQGSEYDNVLVVEQWASFMDMPRWRYTAATRAAKELRYYVPNRK